jgi:type IV fimbrial biogenesis protein FimT
MDAGFEGGLSTASAVGGPGAGRSASSVRFRSWAHPPALLRMRGWWQRGFTALELMVSIAIVAVLVTMAVPGFAGLRRSAGMSAAANELLWTLHHARSSAGLRGLPVTVCLTADDRSCVARPDALAMGWLVFHSQGQTVGAQPSAPESLLHSFRLPAGITVAASRPAITFWPVSRAGSTSTFELCDASGEGRGRSIVVSQTGRPRVAAEGASCER